MAGDGSFFDRTRLLQDEVGRGYIIAACEVDQAYAQNQHETTYWHHEIGRDHFLSGPLMENYIDVMNHIAVKAITTEGSSLHEGMVDTAETMARFVLENAPERIGTLRTSAHPTVESDGILTYDRAPITPRDHSKDDKHGKQRYGGHHI